MKESDFEGVYIDPKMLEAILKLTHKVSVPEDLILIACEIRRERVVEQTLTSGVGDRVYDFDMGDLDPPDADLFSQLDRSDLIKASEAFLNTCYLNVGVGADATDRLTFWEDILGCDDGSSTLMLNDYETAFLEAVFPVEFNSRIS